MRGEKVPVIAEVDTAKLDSAGAWTAGAARAVQFLLWRSSGFVFGAVVSGAFIMFGMLLSEGARMTFIAEHGFIENLTIVAYGAVIVALLVVSRDDRTFFTASAAVVALMAARELDLHKAFTSGSVYKLRTYTGDTPLGEKLIVGGIVIVLGLFLVWYVIRYAARFGRALKLGHPVAYSVLTAILLLSGAKILDSFARVFLGVTGVRIDTGTALQLPEEVFELAAPVVFLWAVGQYAARRSSGTFDNGG